MNHTLATTVVSDSTSLDPFALVRHQLSEVEQILQDELHSEAPFVDELLVYVANLGGKRLRPTLVLLTGQATGELAPEHEIAAAVMEMIHLATLVHDDVLDNAPLRRHQATVHRVWGHRASILLGDHLFSRAFHLASTLGDTYACNTIGLSTNVVCEGELLQLGQQGNWKTTEKEYFTIIRAKTAELCACCCRLGAYYSQTSPVIQQALETFGYQFGLAFQIVDDILDLTGNVKKMGKETGIDWQGRQLTLPMIHFLHHAGAAGNGSTTSPSAIRQLQQVRSQSELRDLLTRMGSIDYAREHAQQFTKNARLALNSLPASAYRLALESVCDAVVTRVR